MLEKHRQGGLARFRLGVAQLGRRAGERFVVFRQLVKREIFRLGEVKLLQVGVGEAPAAALVGPHPIGAIIRRRRASITCSVA